MSRRILFAAAAGIVATTAIAGSAATLGGLNGGTLGADDTVVASCDTDGVTVAYTTAYDAPTTSYKTTAVNLTSVNAACNGKSYSLTVADNTGASLNTTTGTLTVAAGAATVTLSASVSAEAIEHLALVIYG